jgi:Fe-S-cluster containining protein
MDAKADLRAAFPDLESLYGGLPSMPCISCGLCCVTPHMTLLEFACLLKGMLAEWPRERLVALVSEPMEPEGRYPGNFKCRVQDGRGLCALHRWRPLICRLEGFPVLNRMGIRDHEICPYITDDQLDVEVKDTDIDRWVAHAFRLSNRFYPVYEEPYWLSSLTPECWMAVALDETIGQEPIMRVQAMIREAFDLDFLEPHYRDITRIAEQFDMVDRFFEEAEKKRPRKAVKILRAILHDFPRTGSYYQSEGLKYFNLMKEIVRKQRRG